MKRLFENMEEEKVACIKMVMIIVEEEMVNIGN